MTASIDAKHSPTLDQSQARLDVFFAKLLSDLEAGRTSPGAIQGVFDVAFGSRSPDILLETGGLDRRALKQFLASVRGEIFADTGPNPTMPCAPGDEAAPPGMLFI